MTDTMLERAARALAGEFYAAGADETTKRQAEEEWVGFVSLAKAALLAIRESVANELLYRLAGHELVHEGEAEDWLHAWQEAISAILNEEA